MEKIDYKNGEIEGTIFVEKNKYGIIERYHAVVCFDSFLDDYMDKSFRELKDAENFIDKNYLIHG